GCVLGAERHAGMGDAMIDLAARLKAQITAAGIAVSEVVIGDESDRSTWKVQPETLQALAQPTINGFTFPTPAQLADEDAAAGVDGQKAINATVRWALRRILGRPPTPAELITARSEWMAIYKALP
ncbi:MAG: hypothetical protein RLY20_1889, partial [Verrucomicrobiota bacterium]